MNREISTANQSSLFGNLEPLGRILELDGYHVWGTSPIRDDEGRIHVFFSRWVNRASHYGWVMCCEVAHAVADSPAGPYEVKDVALEGRGGRAWDSWSIHNPTVHKVGDKYAIFYMGSDGSHFDKSRDELIELSRSDWEAYWPYFKDLVAHKSVGLAVADSLDGPWKRVGDAPAVPHGSDGEWDDFVTSNPAYLTHPDGRQWLYYKGWSKATAELANGNRQYGLAIADTLEGPYRKIDGNPLINLSHLGDNTQCEDAYIFYSEKEFHMVMRDMGVFNNSVGLHFTSPDGLEWSLPKIAYREAPFYFDEPLPGLDREGRLERPQILMKDGKPEYLFCAYVGGSSGTSSAVVLKFRQ